MNITEENHTEHGSGTLIVAYDGIDRTDISSEDIPRQVELLTLKSAIGQTLEERGWQFDEEDNEWFTTQIN